MMDKDIDFLQAFMRVIEPLVDKIADKAVERAMREIKDSSPEDDVVLVDEAARILMKAKATVYVKCSNKYRQSNPDEEHIPVSRRGNRLYFSRKAMQNYLMNGQKK